MRVFPLGMAEQKIGRAYSDGSARRIAAHLAGERFAWGYRLQNFVTSVKLNSSTLIAGTTMSNDSSPLVRTGALI